MRRQAFALVMDTDGIQARLVVNKPVAGGPAAQHAAQVHSGEDEGDNIFVVRLNQI